MSQKAVMVDMQGEMALQKEGEIRNLIQTLKDQKTANKRKVEFNWETHEALVLFLTKNDEYLDAISRTGVLGVSVELVGIAARLEALVIRSKEHGRENEKSLRNALTDALVYATVGLIMLGEKNFEGKTP